VSLLLYLEPVVSVAGAAVFLGERVSLVMIGGGLLILTGVAVSGTGRPADIAVTAGPLEEDQS
jgi:drug/metabolite transporter (DMT)-like permease